jgi:hypothetical protein
MSEWAAKSVTINSPANLLNSAPTLNVSVTTNGSLLNMAVTKRSAWTSVYLECTAEWDDAPQGYCRIGYNGQEISGFGYGGQELHGFSYGENVFFERGG